MPLLSESVISFLIKQRGFPFYPFLTKKKQQILNIFFIKSIFLYKKSLSDLDETLNLVAYMILLKNSVG